MNKKPLTARLAVTRSGGHFMTNGFGARETGFICKQHTVATAFQDDEPALVEIAIRFVLDRVCAQ